MGKDFHGISGVVIKWQYRDEVMGVRQESGVVETDIVRRTIPVDLIGAYESVMPRASGMCDIWWWISIVMCIKES